MPDECLADRIRLGLAMADYAERRQRARLRRQCPFATGAQIEQAIQRWYWLGGEASLAAEAWQR
jgi:Rv0078B-related antitoxin